jgi:hypothetical protein
MLGSRGGIDRFCPDDRRASLFASAGGEDLSSSLRRGCGRARLITSRRICICVCTLAGAGPEHPRAGAGRVEVVRRTPPAGADAGVGTCMGCGPRRPGLRGRPRRTQTPGCAGGHAHTSAWATREAAAAHTNAWIGLGRVCIRVVVNSIRAAVHGGHERRRVGLQGLVGLQRTAGTELPVAPRQSSWRTVSC